MKFTDLFIRRPVLAIVVNLVILIAGLQSIRALSVRQYPRSDIAVVRVSTTDARHSPDIYFATYQGLTTAHPDPDVPADTAEARELLQLKGGDAVAF